MGFRFSKSIRVGKHMRINLSKRGIGTSYGVKGFRVGTGPRGTRVTASIPGTGISYVAQGGKRSGKRGAASTARQSLHDLPSDPLLISLQQLTDEEFARRQLIAPMPADRSAFVGFIFWMFFGLLGGHRYYFGLKRSAVIQTLTLGGAGIWWLLDLFLLRKLARDTNRKRTRIWAETIAGMAPLSSEPGEA